MLKRTKSPSPFSTPSPTLDSHPRNPRVHRQSGIPSINRPRGLSGAGVSNETNTPRIGRPLATKIGYQHPSRDQNAQVSTPTSHHRRLVSMPQPLPSVIQAQIDIDGDRIARGLISPPIVDFTHFDDRYRGPRSGHFEGLVTKTKQTNGSNVSIKPILKRNPQSFGVMKNNTSDMILDPHPASLRKPDPRLIVSALEAVVLDPLKKPADLLDVFDLLGMHQLDQLDFEERDIARGNSSQSYPRGERVVLGEPVRKASIYASTAMVLGGREHELPILVVSCIEELYRTGMYQSNLFRTLPNRSRLLELINIFDSEQQPPGSFIRSRHSLPPRNPVKPGFGANTSLHLESTPDICALLSTYLSALPEPILLPALFRPIWDWCAVEEDEVDTSQLKPFGRHLSSVPLSRTYTNPTESTHILIAQLVLHLLPSPHFSLLVYILAFFSQVAMVHEENGVGMEDLARMFGERIFGGGQSRRRKLSAEIAMIDAHEPRMEGEVMMCWFLRRWGPISESLFDVIEDAKMGALQDQQDMRRSVEKPSKRYSISIPLGHSLSNAETPRDSSGCDTPSRPTSQDDVSRSGGDSLKIRSPSFHPPPHDESPFKIRPNPKTSNGGEDLENDSDKISNHAPPAGRSLDNETFDIPIDTMIDGESVCSATALDERLLDVSMPTLLHQTFPIGPFNDEDDDSRSVLPTSIASTADEIDKARQRILSLEAELEESNKAAAESLQELSKEKLRNSDLESRIEGLELTLELERKKVHDQSVLDPDGYGGMLEVVRKERDDALDLVHEIRKLMIKN
ncbi:Rho GTPase activation protein [Phlegmacium glaucopus]|nr:Rho GTPase activation protein [Phlegmacium glaucopus]